MAQRSGASHVTLAARHQAEQLADRLPPLLVAAERVAATVAQGVHGRRRVGVGETFWQFRPYQPGDSATRIDWRQSARSAQLFLRDQEWEAAESVWLWADTSASMDYHSDAKWPIKAERALVLLLALAALLVRAGERVALLGVDRRPIGGRAGFDAVCDGLRRQSAAPTSLPPAQALPRHARLVLISDFFTPLEGLRARLRGLVGQGVRGHLLQVLDPAEETLPYQGRVEFDGFEGEQRLLANRADALRVAYAERLAAHRQAIGTATRRLEWSFLTHRTDHPAQAALLALYSRIANADRAVRSLAPGTASA
jgi:uncharacterized protein (DUF58 family)